MVDNIIKPQYISSGGLARDTLALPIISSRAPTANDKNYSLGQVWIRTSSNQAWVLTSVAAGSATWALSSPGSSDVDTLTGDAGGPISPAAGDIILAGGTNIGTSGAGNTITFNLDNAISLSTSVTSPLYTSGAGVDVAVTAPAGQNIVLKMGDAAGANKVSFVDSAAAEVFAIDSNGGIGALAGLTVTGAFTQTAGVVNISADNSANAVNIGLGNVARNIAIGSGAAAHAVTLGSTTAAASVLIQSGTGDVNVTSTDEINLDATGVLQLNSSNAAISIGNDANAFAINVGTGAAARTITVGNITGATAVNINTGTGGSAITTTDGVFGVITGTGAINVGTDAAAKTITIGNVTGATAVNVNSGTGACAWTTTNGSFGLVTGTGAINIGADAAAKTVTIGNVTGATAVNVNSGTGACAWTTTNGSFGLVTGTGAINLGADAAAKTITIGNGTGATSVVVDCGTGALNIGTNAIAHTTTIGNNTGASSVVVDVGTGALNLGTTATVHTTTVGSATGASSTVIQNGTGACNIGSNATDHTTTVGSVTGASSTVLQAGTAGFTVTGTINDMTAKFQTVTGDRITFTQSPIAQSALNTGAAPTGVTGDVNLLAFQNGIIMEEYVVGAGQTIIAPRMSATGLSIGGDLTATEGYQYGFDATRANSRHSFTIGTSPAFYIELTFSAADVSSMEPTYVGFRKTQAYAQDYTTYTDFACFGLNNAVSTGKAIIATQLNTGGITSTDTTDVILDTAEHTYRINVDAAGACTFLLDGIAPSVTQAFSFDNGDVVHPIIVSMYGAGVGGGDTVHLVSMEVGYQ